MDSAAPLHRRERTAPALSFGGVADAYDRARPSYPPEAVRWLAGPPAPSGADVLELGAGTGRLTEELVRQGHRVVATDPLDAMLRHLVRRLPGTRRRGRRRRADPAARPVGRHRGRRRSASTGGTSTGRCRRSPGCSGPGGHLSLTWNLRDERIPWVRRLGCPDRHAGAAERPDARAAVLEPVRLRGEHHVPLLAAARPAAAARPGAVPLEHRDDDRERAGAGAGAGRRDVRRATAAVRTGCCCPTSRTATRPSSARRRWPTTTARTGRPLPTSDDGGDADALLIDFQ